MSTKIIYLSEQPQLYKTCAAWFFGQWGCHEENSSLDEALEKFKGCAQKEQIPLTFLALHDGLPVGMASLWDKDFEERPDLSPWLAAVYVHPKYRGKDIATLLCMRCKEEAKHIFNIRKLYLITSQAKEGLYKKVGFDIIEQGLGDKQQTTLMQSEQ